MLEIFRWLQGYVCFTIYGKFPERFINIVTKYGIAIWDTKRIDGNLCACMYVRDYLRIRTLAKKSKVRLEITEKTAETSNVMLKSQKDTSKATQQEKQTATVVYNAIAEALQKLN